MPLLWRYLIVHFLKITTACALAFVAMLLAMRLEEIARFATLGAPVRYFFIFILHQIPYILPIALPLSCLIASFLLIQRLSNTYELTALRAGGFALLDISAPLLITAAFLSSGNFWLASELATESHLQTNSLKNELRALNPLLLLQNKHFMRLKGFYFAALGASQGSESACDVIWAIPNKYQRRLNLVVAQQFRTAPFVFTGWQVSFISGMASEKEEDFDHLLIENMDKSVTDVKDFSHLLQEKARTIHNDYLNLSLLVARMQEQERLIGEALAKGEGKAQLKSLTTERQRVLSEVTRRLSVALAVFTFTLMGIAFGINISRNRHYYSLYLAIVLAAVYLIAFFAAKGMERHAGLAAALYLFPHGLIIAASILFLRRASKGIE